MKNLIKFKRLALAIALAGMVGSTANADTTNGSAVANVIVPLSIVEVIGLDFGTVSGGPTAGTVVMSEAGVRSTTGDAEIIAADNGNEADFTITGQGGQAYTLSFSASGTLVSGANSMTVDSFTTDASGTITAGVGAQVENIKVGATLNLIANQPAGSYTTVGGTPYTITVNYN
jgi:hypothetical protein